jgi:hypothetical protein
MESPIYFLRFSPGLQTFSIVFAYRDVRLVKISVESLNHSLSSGTDQKSGSVVGTAWAETLEQQVYECDQIQLKHIPLDWKLSYDSNDIYIDLF